MKNLFFILALFFGGIFMTVTYSADNYEALAPPQEKPFANQSRKVKLSSGGYAVTFEVNGKLSYESIKAAVAIGALATGVPIRVGSKDCHPDASIPANATTINTIAELEVAAERFAREVLTRPIN